MAVIETWLHQDADSLVEVVPLKGNLFYGDDGGNLIGVEVTRAGAAVSLPSGCYGYGILSNGTTEYISGTVSGNRAYVILPKEWCACVGPISIVIKTGATMQAVPNEGTKPVGGVTLAACTGYVYKTRTDTIVDPGSALPDIGQLEAAIANCIAATTNAEKVNISQSKSGNTITVTTTNRNGQSTNQTLTEPTVSVTKHGTTDPVPAREGDFDITVIGPNASGNIVTHTVTIPNPNAELSDRAHVNTVSRLKTRTGNPIKIEDAVNEIADKTVIKLVPKQDLHGYDKPWVGGAGKNLLPMNHVSNVNPNSPNITVTDSSDGWLVVNGTASANFILISNLFSGTMDLTNQSDNIKHLPNGSYKMAIWTSGTGVEARLQMYKSDGTNASLVLSLPSTAASNVAEVTIDDTFTYNFCRLFIGAGTYTNFKVRVMVCKSTDDATTFAPYTNICPISGYDTVNVYDCGTNLVVIDKIKTINSTAENIRNGLEFTNPGQYTVSGKATASTAIYARIVSATGVYGTYSVIVNATTGATVTYTVQEGEKLIVFDASESTVSASKDKFVASCVQIEFGATGTEYAEPGVAYPIAVSLATNGNQTAGTVYSGTVTLLADGSGQVKVDSAILTEQDFISIDSNVSTGGLHFTQLDNRGNPAAVAGICNMMGVDTTGAAWNSTIPVVQMATAGRIRVYGAFTTISEFKTQFAGLQIVYPLTNPLTFTLTANQVQTLLGYNYIYTDGTEIALTYRQESLATNETLLKLLPTGTATGNPVTFSDGADGVPLKQLVVNVEPKQDLHGYDKPWVAGAGKNLCPTFAGSSAYGVTASVQSDGSVKLSGTASGSDIFFYPGWGYTTLPAGSYTVTGGNATGKLRVSKKVSGADTLINHETGNGLTFTLSESTEVSISIRVQNLSGTTINTTVYPMIRKSTDAEGYAPYENICPIRGWDSVPLLRAEGIIKNPENIELGNIEANGSEVDSTTRLRTGYTQVTENTKYTIEYSHTAGTYCGIFYFSGTTPDTFISYESWAAQPRTFTTPNGANYVRFTFQSPTLPTNVRLKTDNMKSYDISIPSEAGTVYGCQIVLDENGEGELKVIKKLARAGDMSWSYYDAYTYYGGMFFSDDLKSVIRHDSEDIVFATSSAYVGLTGAQSKAKGEINEHINGGIRVRTSDGRIYIRSDDYNNASAFATANKDVEICYELANPITYSLTADQVKTLLGTNIISSDAGNVEVEYFQKLSDKGTGEYSHVEGRSTIASGLASHAEGDATEATGASAHSEGYSTHATGNNSHAEGMNSTASGEDSHAEGFLTTASGDFSHAEGSTATASGQSSHAEGKGTIANHLAQHVFGMWNVPDPSYTSAASVGSYVEIVGNGTNVSAKHNARTLDWNGNEWLAGSLTLGNTTLTEAKLAELVSISSATGVTF